MCKTINFISYIGNHAEDQGVRFCVHVPLNQNRDFLHVVCQKHDIFSCFLHAYQRIERHFMHTFAKNRVQKSMQACQVVASSPAPFSASLFILCAHLKINNPWYSIQSHGLYLNTYYVVIRYNSHNNRNIRQTLQGYVGGEQEIIIQFVYVESLIVSQECIYIYKILLAIPLS